MSALATPTGMHAPADTINAEVKASAIGQVRSIQQECPLVGVLELVSRCLVAFRSLCVA